MGCLVWQMRAPAFAALHTLSYTARPDVLLQRSEKQPACFVCLYLKGLQNFPGKSDIKSIVFAKKGS